MSRVSSFWEVLTVQIVFSELSRKLAKLPHAPSFFDNTYLNTARQKPGTDRINTHNVGFIPATCSSNIYASNRAFGVFSLIPTSSSCARLRKPMCMHCGVATVFRVHSTSYDISELITPVICTSHKGLCVGISSPVEMSRHSLGQEFNVLIGKPISGIGFSYYTLGGKRRKNNQIKRETVNIDRRYESLDGIYALNLMRRYKFPGQIHCFQIYSDFHSTNWKSAWTLTNPRASIVDGKMEARYRIFDCTIRIEYIHTHEPKTERSQRSFLGFINSAIDRVWWLCVCVCRTLQYIARYLSSFSQRPHKYFTASVWACSCM